MNPSNDPLTADASAENLEGWAFLEIYGHTQIAGLVTTRKLGVAVLLQVDVPNPVGPGFAYSKLYNPSSIFSIQPTNEAWCRKWAAQAHACDRPVLPYIPEPKALTAQSEESAQGGLVDTWNEDEDD